jgi:uncharacterized protein
MKLHLSSTGGQNFFSGYGDGYVQINQQRYIGSLVVLPNQIIENWLNGGIEKLSAQDFEVLLNRELEIVLIGTGKNLHFPNPAIFTSLIKAQIGYEVMDTHAACRTYNILLGEGRKVAAALLI